MYVGMPGHVTHKPYVILHTHTMAKVSHFISGILLIDREPVWTKAADNWAREQGKVSGGNHNWTDTCLVHMNNIQGQNIII